MEPYEYRKYYSRQDIVDSLFANSRDKEMVPVFYGSRYGRRPSCAEYKGDIINWINMGASSFHNSVENWKNPMNIVNSKFEMDQNRTSFDLLFDIDADKGIEFAKIAAILLIEELQKHNIKNIYAKFSGNRGFHIAVSHKTMPERIGDKEIKLMYPQLLQQTAAYLKDRIRGKLKEQYSKLLNKDVSNPYAYADIEENWSNRHLFRMPYSLNEKTYLASIVLDIAKIKYFRKEDAKIQNVKQVREFLTKKEPNESQELLVRANDYFSFEQNKTLKEKHQEKTTGFEKKVKISTKFFLEKKIKNMPASKRRAYRDALDSSGSVVFAGTPEKIRRKAKESQITKKEETIYNLFVMDFKEAKTILSNKKIALLFVPLDVATRIRQVRYRKTLTAKISFDYFPPCIKTILAGIDDGKKRAVFIMINFLTSCGWDREDIKQLLMEWNTKNTEPLKEHYISSQLSYAKNERDAAPPPNCTKSGYYTDLGVCHRDEFCIENNIKNPVSYALKKYKFKKKK
ncbi:MAG: hypothetical protein DRN66_00005 [Candidatus Nanohalarchaeota archaeon]|nr:MAG: hypothetical protein DRN66_00005 [Candidatus Nanohaloarchaeota archaeon]